jgi:hypothetical protein
MFIPFNSIVKRKSQIMSHIVLAGDSIFDNESYVGENESVIEQLNQKIPNGVVSTLLAVDGDVTSDVRTQLKSMPSDATHLFVSCGGNDALNIAGVLTYTVSSVAEAMELFTEIREEFRQKYTEMLSTCIKQNRKFVVCTIHDSVPDYEERALTALAFFNEIILKEATKLGLPIIDLRLTCNSAADYSPVSTIEPSREGGRKISDVILRVFEEHDFESNITHVYF